MNKSKLKNNHELGRLIEEAVNLASDMGISSKEVEKERIGASLDGFDAMTRVEKRLLSRDRYAISDNISNFGDRGALELLFAIGTLLMQNWGPTDREKAKELEEYIIRRRGRENMKRAKK